MACPQIGIINTVKNDHPGQRNIHIQHNLNKNLNVILEINGINITETNMESPG